MEKSPFRCSTNDFRQKQREAVIVFYVYFFASFGPKRDAASPTRVARVLTQMRPSLLSSHLQVSVLP